MENADDRKVMTQPEKVNYIVSKSADYFGVSRTEILKNNYKKKKISGKRKFVVYLLYKFTACNNADISRIMNYKSQQNIAYFIKQTEDELSNETYGNEKSKMIYKELLSYLNL